MRDGARSLEVAAHEPSIRLADLERDPRLVAVLAIVQHGHAGLVAGTIDRMKVSEASPGQAPHVY